MKKILPYLAAFVMIAAVGFYFFIHNNYNGCADRTE